MSQHESTKVGAFCCLKVALSTSHMHDSKAPGQDVNPNNEVPACCLHMSLYSLYRSCRQHTPFIDVWDPQSDDVGTVRVKGID